MSDQAYEAAQDRAEIFLARALRAEQTVARLTRERDEARAGCAALREALVKVRAHTGFRPDATLQLLVALLASIERITDSTLAQSQPDGTPK